MPQRYSITNRKDSEGPSKLQKSGSNKEQLHTASVTTSKNMPLIVGAISVLAVTNIATFALTFGVMQSQISKLRDNNKNLLAELDNYKKTYGSSQVKPKDEPNKNNAPVTNITVPKSTADAAKLATDTRNSIDIKPVLAPTVTVTIAGSSTTTQPAEQAANSLAFLNDARGPWNWNPSQQQLDQLRTGPYAQYFGDNTIIGVSANGYAVSYTVNAQGQITAIFITPSIPAASSGSQLSE